MIKRITSSKIFQYVVASIASLFILFLIFVYWSSEHYPDLTNVEVKCRDEAPLMDPKKPVKVVTWNIQFLAGKNYIFFYDPVVGEGKDERPTQEDIYLSSQRLTRVLKEEDPDFILLQEVDVDAKRTDREDQVLKILNLLNKQDQNYPCSTSTYYWRARYIPHSHIMGSVGMKIVIISKYKITNAHRYALGMFPTNFIDRQFRPKRALLQAQIATKDNSPFYVLNTHLEAFSQGSDLLKNQVEKISTHLKSLTRLKIPWILGGDFNLLMPGLNFEQISPLQQTLYQKDSELKILLKDFKSIPRPEDINGPTPALWYTHFPNDPDVKAPDRTIDYIFYSPLLKPLTWSVRNGDTLKTSDHFPVITTFESPRPNP
jgi:endonuclease/exonuclease/phosphatase family metal-dependent hydrolase